MVEVTLPWCGLRGRLEPPSREHGEGALPHDAQLLEALGRAEATAIWHLERSNEELRAALAVADDQDFRLAVEENRGVLSRKYLRLSEISARLALGAGPAAVLPLPTSSGCARCAGISLEPDGACGCGAAPRGGSRLPSAPPAAAPAPPEGAEQEPAARELAVRLEALLRQVKRKALELEAAAAHGGSPDAAAPPSCKAARLAWGGGGRPAPAPPAASEGRAGARPPPPPDSAAVPGGPQAALAPAPWLATSGEPSGAAAAGEGAAAADAQAERALAGLLRGLKRKAAELEEQAIVDGFCSLSVCQ